MEKPKAYVDTDKCLACGGCIALCPHDAISFNCNKARVDENKCISCYLCIQFCPYGAISKGD
jgi:ferredoxin